MLNRLKSAYKSFSVLAFGALGSSPWWLPYLQSAANGALGDQAQKWATLILAILGIIGWSIPQKSVPKE